MFRHKYINRNLNNNNDKFSGTATILIQQIDNGYGIQWNLSNTVTHGTG